MSGGMCSDVNTPLADLVACPAALDTPAGKRTDLDCTIGTIVDADAHLVAGTAVPDHTKP
jgi:hypothetical protein